MNPRQIVVIAAALLAAVASLFLVRGMMRPPAPAPAAEAPGPTGPMVLVAAQAIKLGKETAAGDFKWVELPKEVVGAAFLTKQANPTALEDHTGAVARIEIQAGEPIISERLVKRGDRGVLAALLEPEHRAFAVSINEASAAAGFILPGDRVDVLLTADIDVRVGEDTESVARSDVVLENVRVLAIDQTFSAAPSDKGEKPTTVTGGVATLELTPADAEILAMAGRIGSLSLALRSARDAPPPEDRRSAVNKSAPVLRQIAGAAQVVTLHAGGAVSTVEAR